MDYLLIDLAMEILEGLLKINGVDVYTAYGAFLCEEKQGEYTNYAELLKPPSMKEYKAVSFREENGEQLPDTLPSPRYEARDVTLYFAIVANNRDAWINKYNAFVTMLKSGWLRIEVPELYRIYKMYYKRCSQYTQITAIENGAFVAAKLKIKLREPQPNA